MDLTRIVSDPQRLHQNRISTEEAYERLKAGDNNPRLVEIVATVPKRAYFYARDIIKGRFPEGEVAIAKDPEWALYYAHGVIKGRFPEGEAAIATDLEWAYNYACDVIEGRFPKGEAAIAKDPTGASEYYKLTGIEL